MPTPSAVSLSFQKPWAERQDTIAVLSLNRPESANAFNGAMITGIITCLQEVAAQPHCRCLILQGKGKHLSAGADLAWMQEAAQLSYAANITEAETLASMFEQLATLPLPTIAVVRGAAYGGAVGLVACCDFALATDTAKFCLSEISLGLLPAVILPHLQRKISVGQLRRLSLTALPFAADEARSVGLIEQVCSSTELLAALNTQLRAILAGGADAQRAFKGLLQSLAQDPMSERQATTRAIAAARTGAEGQEGLRGFLNKTPPSWRCQLPAEWSVEL